MKVAAVVAVVGVCAVASAADRSVPDLALTPGVARHLTLKVICETKWGRDARVVTEAMKRQVATAYKLKRESIVAYGRGPCCEFDHLISRENGGADDVRNLWPQPWVAAKLKDRIENKLHTLLCAGTLDLKTVQADLSGDWRKAYVRYIGPLPKLK